MKAVVVIALDIPEDSGEEQAGISLTAHWVADEGPVGSLTAVQTLTMLDSATQHILQRTEFKPPSAILKADAPIARAVLHEVARKAGNRRH